MEVEKSKGSGLIRHNRIRKVNLERNRYTVSLLREGLRTGMLTSQEVYSIEVALMRILQDLIRRYTRGKSSSVTSETAENIMASMMYAVDACVLHFETPDQAVLALKNGDARKIYENGVELVRQCFEETKQLYLEVKKNRLDVPVDAYNMTIDESLPAFLEKYGIIFDAHNTMASIDYPLALDDTGLQGVSYINQYLRHLQTETQFCRLFSRQGLLELLSNYGQVCRFNYRIELFNIFELVLNNAVFSVLSGGDANRTTISAEQYNLLNRMFTRLNPSRIAYALDQAMSRLQYSLKTAPPLTDYMTRCRDQLVQRVVTAADNRSLESVIIWAKAENPKSIVLLLNISGQMSDVRFRQLMEEILLCAKIEEKVRLIRDNFSSLHDLLDLLDADCLTGDEYEKLFATFEDVELAIFAKIVFYEELRSGFSDFLSVIFSEKELESNWKRHYVEFLQSLSKSRLNSVGNLLGDIDYEEIPFY